MFGKIETIEELLNYKVKNVKGYSHEFCHSGDSMDGYKIITNEHVFMVLISNGQSCCERWGYLISEDDYKQFIGAKLQDVYLTDKALNNKGIEAAEYLDCGGIIFVNFITDKGVFQLAVYNAHNGYYGHDVLVIKDKAILAKDYL